MLMDPLGMEPTEAPAMACCSPSKNHSTLAVTGQALPTHHGTTPQGPGPPSQGHHTPLQPTKGVLGPSAHARSPSVCTRRTSAAARALYDRAPLRTSCEGVHGCRWCGGSDGGGPQGGWRREHAGGSGGMPPHARALWDVCVGSHERASRQPTRDHANYQMSSAT